MYAIKSPETKKRYPDRFKIFLNHIKSFTSSITSDLNGITSIPGKSYNIYNWNFASI
jgi:hypothetical protein